MAVGYWLLVWRVDTGGAVSDKERMRFAAPADLVRPLADRALPDDPKVHYQLGIAYDGLSQKARARECYRRSRTLNRPVPEASDTSVAYSPVSR